jgi:hypothetical protein
MTKQKGLVSAVAVLLGALITPSPLRAQVLLKQGEDPTARAESLKAQGWGQVGAGFYQRRTGNKVESLALAPEGTARALARLRSRYAGLLEQNGTNPSPQLEKALRVIRQVIARAQRPGGNGPLAVSDCTVSMGANAWAYPENWYVVAIGAAHFRSNCFSGEAYASAYVSTANGQQFQYTYDSGSNVDLATGLIQGGPDPCFSQGYAYSYNYATGDFIDAENSNDVCGS